MGGLSIWHIIVLICAVAATWGLVRVVWRTGASLLWLIPMFIPIIGTFAFLWFTYAKWPKVKDL
ncbi:MAG TPA: hypothetical protein VK759_03025 [Rhizomicrobium sp.]|jgi:hypothetical protein|nr:hypothetical protein [Rhizomicrobium sp.]